MMGQFYKITTTLNHSSDRNKQKTY